MAAFGFGVQGLAAPAAPPAASKAPLSPPRAAVQSSPRPGAATGPAASVSGGRPSAQPRLPSEGPLWEAWYTVTGDKGVHYGYYTDKVQVKQGRIHYQNRFLKQEDGYLSEENLGVFAQNNYDLTPLFFNFQSSYRSTETKIDGSVQPDGKTLIVKVKKGRTDLPQVKRTLPPKVIFSSLFPMWLGYRLHMMREGQEFGFYSVMEDNVEENFAVVPGAAKLEPPDEFSIRTKTSKLQLRYRKLTVTWYIDGKGIPVRIEMPAIKTVIEKVNQAQAEKFLDE